MPLPKIATPIYELEIPSLKKKIRYRPFLVKEEKILIIAMESEDSKQIGNAVKTVISNCILTKGIKIDDLATFDIEYLFLNLRSKSVGESIELIITCGDDMETQVPVTIYIDEIQVQKEENHSTDIKLDSSLVLRMKYPSLDQFIKNNFDFNTEQSTSNIEKSLDIIASCIDMIFNEEESWAASDCTKKELVSWIETLDSNQFKQVENFFNTMPKLAHKVKVKNPKTGVESEVTLEGLTSFFG